MDKNKICEAMYALPQGVVVRRRKPLLIPSLLLLAGVTILVLNNVYGAELSNNLRSSAVFLGGLLAIAGIFALAVRLLNKEGIPFHKPAKCYLRYEELYFSRVMRREVMQSIEQGDVARLLDMDHAQVPAVAVAVYRTPDNRFAAMQAFEYADLEYKPLTDLKIVAA